MRANVALLLLALVAPALQAAVSQTNWPDAAVMKFVFVENNADDNFFRHAGRRAGSAHDRRQ